MSGYHIALSLNGNASCVGGGLSLQQASEISDAIFDALVDELGSRISVYPQADN